MTIQTDKSIQPIVASWPLGDHLVAFTTTRLDGFSSGLYHGLNTGYHVDDDEVAVAKNRAMMLAHGKVKHAQWLDQVHGIQCIEASLNGDVVTADACWTDQANLACVVMTADCLPVVFSQGNKVAAAHAGWRGLLNGVLENTLQQLIARDTYVWFGPAIGPSAFEVGGEVREQFIAKSKNFVPAFKACQLEGKWLADIYLLARLTLLDAGVPAGNIFGGEYCTYNDEQRFYSYRRQNVTGRLATLIMRRADQPLSATA